MAANADRKIAEAREHVREAEKCLKTGLLKWKPDYDGAAVEYGKAAVAYKNAKAHDEAIDSYMKQADAQKQMGSIFHAAKSIEAAGMLCKESGNLSRAADLIEQAATMYLEHGTQDTAAVVLDRAAKMLEQSLPQRAIKLFMRACEVAEAEDRPHQSAEYVGRAARVLIRTKQLDEAADALRREMDYYNRVDNQGLLNKLVMGIVLVHLHRGDYVAADQAFKASLSKYAGFAQSEEAGPIERLLDAYYECDQEAAEQVVKSPLFRYMENDFTKLARDLKVPGGGASKKSSSQAASSGGDGNDVNAAETLADNVEELDLR
jgi:tetratricopeptide (TPR) repeat protein